VQFEDGVRARRGVVEDCGQLLAPSQLLPGVHRGFDARGRGQAGSAGVGDQAERVVEVVGGAGRAEAELTLRCQGHARCGGGPAPNGGAVTAAPDR
jgi:hypothetical protein